MSFVDLMLTKLIAVLKLFQTIKSLLSVNNSVDVLKKQSLEEGMTLKEDAECPYCNSKFEKPLYRKKRVLYVNKTFMFVSLHL